MMNLRKFNYIFLLFSTIFIFSCQQEAEETPTPTNPNSGINRFVWNYMRERYLWNDKMPQNINPDRFTTPQLLLDAIIFKESDRFTSIVKDDGARLNQITTGSAAGYGVLIGQDAQRNWRFLSVFPNSPASEAGLTRGMRIISVDGKATTPTERPTLNTSASSTIEVEDTEGKIRVITATPRTYTQQPVIHTEIRTVGSRKIGYIVYQSFTQVSEEALTRTFAQFRSEGVSELIVDLRYNGGGLVRTLQILGSMIAPANAIGRPLLKNQNNERNSRENSDILFENNPNRLNLNRVAFIATGSSASASEILINNVNYFTFS
ncbi:S41 family peptidase [Thermoflexibacter ruber]|uniref:Peptidase family S41 n=1 Tax=Thermoflexibacter ruber TaxID=1003 RepID=A0A1I2B9N7_9BACT|nr:S41 family peptidase [Thermoflexibacter ruber]SFE52912.1 Peptidase family S41 [Thermoflexibacter ruber]